MYPVFAGSVLVALLSISATSVSLLSRQHSSAFLFALLGISVGVAVVARVLAGDVSDLPVIFSPAIFIPLGLAVASGTAVVLAVRVATSRRTRSRPR